MPLLLFNKPYGVLSQFTDAEHRSTLADFIHVKGVYAAGRLDRDSEGLLVLTSDGRLQQRIADPEHKLEKTYWVQVEGIVDENAAATLCTGVVLRDGPARAIRAESIDEPVLWLRTPPIRYRKSVPTSWLSITIDEGRNRQVRRMTAAIGLPALRVVRVAVGTWTLGDLGPGQWRDVPPPV